MLLRFHPIKLTICLLVISVLFTSFCLLHRSNNEYVVGQGFAVVELFTSEGCSSCPPADEAVGRLKGWKKNLYILSFHVDYWNYLGWKDVFSDPAYSGRQQEYGTFFHLSNIYTPQIVVNGRVEFVGSEESHLREAIEKSISEIPATDINIKVLQESNHRIPVSISSDGNPALKLNLALVQNFATDFIQRGENKGKKLSHFFIVRDFKVQPNPKGLNTYFLNSPSGFRSSDYSVIAFLQDSNNGHIIAAAGSPIP